MKTLILVRHGETKSNNKSNKRHLTTTGKRQINSRAKLLKKFINGKLAIIYSPTVRARQTAKIIASVIKTSILSEAELRIKNADLIAEFIHNNKSRGIRPAKTYLEMTDYRQFLVESPMELFKRLETIIEKYDIETILLVSHEASLEGFLLAQNKYKIVYKTFSKYFEYGDFAILEPIILDLPLNRLNRILKLNVKI